MRQTALLLGFALAALTLTAPLGRADEPPVKSKVAIGDKIPDLDFKDIRYLPRSLSDFGKTRAFVIIAATTSCPLNQRYWPRLEALAKANPGAQFLALNVEARDSIKEIATQAIRYKLSFPFVKDTDGSAIKALGLGTTAQVAILDSKRRLRYRGRIDDQYRFGGSRPKASKHELADALAAVLAGKKVAVSETPVDGCRINFQPAYSELKTGVTYSEQVAPLIQKNCQDCHRPGGLAPCSRLTDEDAAKSAAMIAEVVAEERMPPWSGSEKYKGFSNHRGLSADERLTLISWARSGAKLGDTSKAPAPRSFPSAKWRIGKPDLILDSPQEFELPADGYVPYQYFLFNRKFPHDRWIQAIEIRPSNDKVLHHCNLIYFKVGKDGKRRETTFVTGVVPGSGPTVLDPGIAVRIPKGATMALQAHYVTTGKPETDRLSVGFRFARGIIKKELHNLRASDRRFEIPAGASNHEVRASVRLPRNASVLSLFSHMHLRGKDMEFFVRRPGAKRESLLLIPNYSFDWQQSYSWDRGAMRLPKGSLIEVVAHYDNSSFNPFNPDPKSVVRYGDQTYHEMMFGFVFYVDVDESLELRVNPRNGRALGRRGASPKKNAAPKPSPTPAPKRGSF